MGCFYACGVHSVVPCFHDFLFSCGELVIAWASGYLLYMGISLTWIFFFKHMLMKMFGAVFNNIWRVIVKVLLCSCPFFLHSNCFGAEISLLSWLRFQRFGMVDPFSRGCFMLEGKEGAPYQMELITSATSLNGMSLFPLSFIIFQNSILQCLTNWQSATQIVSYFLFAPIVLGADISLLSWLHFFRGSVW